MSKLIFEPVAHTYTVDGKRLPSVTEITRFLSVDIAAGASSWLRDVAADRGTRVHQYCALVDFDEMPDFIDPDCAGYVKAYMNFLTDYAPVWTHIEYPLYSLERGYAGTLDRLGTIGGETVLADIKTSAKIHKIALSAQLTGYDLLCENSLGIGLDHLYGIYLRRDGTYKLHESQFNYKLWCDCESLHRALEQERTSKRQ